MKSHRLFLIGTILAVIVFTIFLIIGNLGWEGSFNLCYPSECFCEQISSNNVVIETVNTWSNLFYTVIGLMILWKIDKTHGKKAEDIHNPMDHPSFYSILYGFLVLNIGFGSWLFHANMREYGGIWDVGSMNMYMTFLLVYFEARNFRLSIKWFLIIYIPLNIVLFYELIFIKIYGTLIFTILVAISASIEMFSLIWIKMKGQLRGLTRNWVNFAFGFVIFNLGFIIWNLTNTGRLFCFPDTLWQGHAFWHLFTAIATYFFYLYMTSEKPILK